jgi:hypothetical protein
MTRRQCAGCRYDPRRDQGGCDVRAADARAEAEEAVVSTVYTCAYRDLIEDPRNLVPVAFVCHERHHSRFLPLELRVLPDSVFEFAAELLGPGPAHLYLARYYRGRDPRLDALLS